jgi:hypothetical protein
MKKNVIIEMKFSENISENAVLGMFDNTIGLINTPIVISGITIDTSYAPVQLSGQKPSTTADSIFDMHTFEFDDSVQNSTYLLRGELEEAKYETALKNKDVVGIYADPVIESFAVCPTGPIGSDLDVERLLCTSKMKAKHMDGTGVLVAIVDTGINLEYLRGRGKTPILDASRSWVPSAGMTPGNMPVDHGTMCAYDVMIAAPNCTLLDIAVLSTSATGPTVMSGVLSDAIKAYNHLINVIKTSQRSLVVNNSWGMFHSSWDFPIGHLGNYSHNPSHPFNRIVGELERNGADILFAAGNCGSDCPDGRCTRNGVRETDKIYGANSHPSVLSIAGVSIEKVRVGYSTKGPGTLTRNKPDIAGYTHFRGSGVYSADGGTSAACPVISGVIAAIRSVKGYNSANPSTSPSAIRSLVTSTAEDVSPAGFDLETGFGIIDGCALVDKLFPITFFDLCRRFPWICELRRIPFPPIPRIPPVRIPRDFERDLPIGQNFEQLDDSQLEEISQYLQSIGYVGSEKKEKKCNCGCNH